MPIPNNPITRKEAYLAAIAGQEVAVPEYPITREEAYLAKIAGQEVAVPGHPITREEAYLDAILNNGDPSGEDLYTKHLPTSLESIEAFDLKSVVYDILATNDRIVAVNHRTSHSVSIVERATSQVTWVAPCPTGADATDKPVSMSDFYNSGNGFVCRSIAETDDYYIIGIRYSGGVSTDGTHLYGGIVFISKTTKTVAKSYWLPYIVTRVVYNTELNILAVALQMDGLRFYSISGTTLTELETFLYDQSSGSSKQGRESQHGCFYSANGREYYANVGFGVGVLFYDVTDSSNIVEVGELILRNYPPFYEGGSSLVHTYTGIVKFPYLYLTIAQHDEETAHYQINGVLTVDITNVSSPKVLNFEHIKSADAAVFNHHGDTKPTEMTNAHGMLYLNYEDGYLAFEIEADGRSTKYCGKYLTGNFIYGIEATPESDIFVGVADESAGYVNRLMETAEWMVYRTLTNISINNVVDRVDAGAAYSATITADTGYEISAVTVKMGGVDITSTAYNDGAISIASVTGNISITATATEISNNYWSASDGISQYTNSKPATISASGNDVTMTISEYNSGFKSIKSISAPTGDLILKLRADTATVNQPSQTNDCIFSIKFMDDNDSKLKELYWITGSSASYLDDIDDGDGISLTARYSDIANATKIQITCRSNAENGSEHYPISMAFTNLRVELG